MAQQRSSLGGMGACPNCDAVIALAAPECPACKASFGASSAWKVQPLAPGRTHARAHAPSETRTGAAAGLQVEHPAFRSQHLSVETAGWFRGPRLLLNGSVLEKRKGRYTVADDAGVQRPVELKYYFFDPIPRLKISGEPVRLAPPLAWYQIAWIVIPLALLFLGGAIGGLIGALAAVANGRVFRSERREAAKHGLSALITAAAIVGYLAIAGALQFTGGRPPTPEQELAGVAAVINLGTPKMVDEQTRLDDVVAGPGLMLTYRHTLPNLTRASMPSTEAFQSFGAALRQRLCASDDVKQLISKDVALKFVYRERDGAPIGEVLVLKTHCR